jgi:CRISPR-associated endonuclease/helicase Cas3
MRRAGELIGLLHDIGKYSQAFQQYLCEASDIADMEMEQKESMKGHVDHSTAGAQWIWKHISSEGARPARQAAELLALCIASHHSGLIDCVKPDGGDDLTRRLTKADANTHLKEALEKLDPVIRMQADALLANPALGQELMTAFESIRSADKDKVIQPFKRGLLLRMLFSCLIDADRTDTADFEKPMGARLRQHGEYVPWTKRIDRLERYLTGFSSDSHVNGLRQQISGHCLEAAARPKGIYTLTVPTGGGKTLASLCGTRWAGH